MKLRSTINKAHGPQEYRKKGADPKGKFYAEGTYFLPRCRSLRNRCQRMRPIVSKNANPAIAASEMPTFGAQSGTTEASALPGGGGARVLKDALYEMKSIPRARSP